MDQFVLKAPYAASGDQPKAIEALADGDADTAGTLTEQLLAQRSVVAEIDAKRILELRAPMGHMKALSGFPAVTRDLALVMPEEAMVGQVEKAIREAGGELLESVRVFDIYRGVPVPPGRKSVAYSLVFRSNERTLSDEDVSPVMEAILAACLKEFGAELRL